MTACKFESLTASPGRRDGFRLTPLRMCSCGRGPARACLLVVPWSICLGRPAESRQRCQAFAQRRGDRDSGRARRGFSRPPSGLKWPRGVSSFAQRTNEHPRILRGEPAKHAMRAWLKDQRTCHDVPEKLRVLAALLEDRANVEPRIPMVRARARASGAVHR